MRHWVQHCKTFFVLAGIAWHAAPLSAKETGVLGGSPEFFVETTFGMSTYKSKMVDSNDTGTGLTYSIGGNAGDERNLGFRYKVDQSTVAFALNDSKVATTWEDASLRYRWGYLFAGIVFGNISMKVTRDNAEYIDIIGKGTGGVAGLTLPTAKFGVFNLTYTTVTMTEVKNGLAGSGDVSVGPRADIDIMGSFDITYNLLDLLVGYQKRAFTLKAEESYIEDYTMTYLGLRLSLYF